MKRNNLYNVIPLEKTIVKKLTNNSSYKNDMLNPVNLTDWSMTCLVSFVMRKRKPHSFSKSYSEEEKPTHLFYTIT